MLRTKAPIIWLESSLDTEYTSSSSSESIAVERPQAARRVCMLVLGASSYDNEAPPTRLSPAPESVLPTLRIRGTVVRLSILVHYCRGQVKGVGPFSAFMWDPTQTIRRPTTTNIGFGCSVLDHAYTRSSSSIQQHDAPNMSKDPCEGSSRVCRLATRDLRSYCCEGVRRQQQQRRGF